VVVKRVKQGARIAYKPLKCPGNMVQLQQLLLPIEMQSGQVLSAVTVAHTVHAVQVQLLPRAALLLATAGRSGSGGMHQQRRKQQQPPV